MLVFILVIAALLVAGTSKPKPKPSSGGGMVIGLAAIVAVVAVGGMGEMGGAAEELVRNPNAPGVNGNGGTKEDYIVALSPRMQVAVRQLDSAMGGTLRIVSGYRTAAYQAELCKSVRGPCAPPGRSLHQHGNAIDVYNWQAAMEALRNNPHIPLCQPLPGNDAGHLSLVGAGEC